MGAPDSPPDFLPTHLVLWVTPWPVSLAPMGFIYDNGNDFMSQHLAPPASLPDTAPSQIVSFGGYPFRPPSVPLVKRSLRASSIHGLGGALCVPVDTAFLSLKTLLMWGLRTRIQKRIYLGCTFAMGFGWRPRTPSFH